MKNQRPPKEEQKTALVLLAQDIRPKPLLVGVAARHLGWWASLPATEVLLDEMVSEGRLRMATKDELSASGLRHGYIPV